MRYSMEQDAIMLSGESANGKYPVEAARTMASIAKTAEAKLNYDAILNKMRESHILNVPNAIKAYQHALQHQN